MTPTIAEGCVFKKGIVLTRLNFRDVGARYDASCSMKNYYFGQTANKVH